MAEYASRIHNWVSKALQFAIFEEKRVVFSCFKIMSMPPNFSGHALCFFMYNNIIIDYLLNDRFSMKKRYIAICKALFLANFTRQWKLISSANEPRIYVLGLALSVNDDQQWTMGHVRDHHFKYGYQELQSVEKRKTSNTCL